MSTCVYACTYTYYDMYATCGSLLPHAASLKPAKSFTSFPFDSHTHTNMHTITTGIFISAHIVLNVEPYNAIHTYILWFRVTPAPLCQRLYV